MSDFINENSELIDEIIRDVFLDSMKTPECFLAEAGDRTDMQPFVVLWPSAQIPRSLLRSEQPF